MKIVKLPYIQTLQKDNKTKKSYDVIFGIFGHCNNKKLPTQIISDDRDVIFTKYVYIIFFLSPRNMSFTIVVE